MPPNRLDISLLRSALPSVLPDFLRSQRWFGGKARAIDSVTVVDAVRLDADSSAFIVILNVAYQSGVPEVYALPLVVAPDSGASTNQPAGPFLRLEDGQSGCIILQDALWRKEFCARLLQAISRGETLSGECSCVTAKPSRALAWMGLSGRGDCDSAVLRGEQSNTSVNYSDRLILKFFRKIEPGVNPDIEVGLFLTEKTSFSHIARTAGSLEFSVEGNLPASLGILQEFIPNRGDAWKCTLAELAAYFDRVFSVQGSEALNLLPSGSVLDRLDSAPPAKVRTWIGKCLDDAALLARRTAELHGALASDDSVPAFAPEPFGQADRDVLIKGMAGLLDRVSALLRDRLPQLAVETQSDALKVLGKEAALRDRLQSLGSAALDFKRVRIHGDYHLGQVLRAANDFVIIDFEGEPARPISERRSKRSPLQDIAGMVRSLHYAAWMGLAEYLRQGGKAGKSQTNLESFGCLWYSWVAAQFLSAYFAASRDAIFLPHDLRATRLLLESFVLEKAIYELGYELNNRPDWVGLPLRGILDLI